MKKRKSKLSVSKKVISQLNAENVQGGKKPKSGEAACDSLGEQTIDYTNCCYTNDSPVCR
ncbi:MAG: hypothetical protein AAF611_21980 [Bacteroidota bacterium]